jgi:hypothetical protein
MFAFGIGSSVNRHLIEGMARIGMGEPFVITKPDQAVITAKKFRKLIESPVLTGINIDFGKFKAYDVEPPNIPDVLANRPVIVFGKWRGSPLGTISLHRQTPLFEKHRCLKNKGPGIELGPSLPLGAAPDCLVSRLQQTQRTGRTD